MKRWLVIILIALVALGAATFQYWQPTPKRALRPPNNDPWKLVSYYPDNPYGTYLGNGFISARIMADGVGSYKGKPLPCYMAGLYDNEKLIPMPTWSDLGFWTAGRLNRSRFEIDSTEPYKQVLDMKTGILTTYATWRVGRKTLKGNIEIIVSRAHPGFALMRVELTPNFNGEVVVGNVLPKSELMTKVGGYLDHKSTGKAEGASVFGTRETNLFVAVVQRLVGRNAFKTKVHPLLQNLVSDGPFVLVKAEAGQKFRIAKYVFVSLGRQPDQVLATAERGLNLAVAKGPGTLIAEHKAAWAKLWEKDIVIEGPAKDQQAIHSCMFYILQSIREGSRWSIPPMGLSSDAFGGHVFWDADTWIFPALILQHPELAQPIVEYRFHTLSGAIANAKESGYKGAEYAWESGYTGIEATPPGLNYRYERHINGDVALAQWQYYLATGDINWLKTRGFPVLKETADYWVSRVNYNDEKSRYEILKVVPPDENAEIVNNSVYTNAIAKLNLEIASRAAKLLGVVPNPKWAEVANKIYIPFDEKNKRFIPFDGYKGFTAKQADTELLAYPLQFKIHGQNMTEIYRNTLEFYQPKVHPNGPAMSSSVHSVIAARLGYSTKAYKFWRESFVPFLRGPFNYFNEKRSQTWQQMCFLTGAAGPVQSVLFGLAGIRMDYDNPAADLVIKPCLPKQWKRLKITGLTWRGKSFNLLVEHGKPPVVIRKSETFRIPDKPHKTQ